MKNLMNILVIFLFLPFSIHGQEETGVPYKKRTFIKINTLSFAGSTISGFIEQYNNSGDSYQIGYFHSISGGLMPLSTKSSFQGINGDVKFGIDIKDNFIFYIGPFARWYRWQIEEEHVITIYNKLGIGGIIGKQWYFGDQKRIIIDAFLAPGYQFRWKKVKNEIPNQEYGYGLDTPLMLRIGLNVGFGLL